MISIPQSQVLPALGAAIFTFAPLPLPAALSLDGGGVSAIWQARYQPVAADDDDADGDGISNRNESIAGTDPSDPASVLDLNDFSIGDEAITFNWSGVAGKIYRLERLDSVNEDWEEVMTFPASGENGPRSVEISRREGRGDFYRLAVSDIDADGDGLSAWEEGQLGWSDEDDTSSGDPERGDFAVALRGLESDEGLLLSDGTRLPQWLPGDAAAARFLLRASFGPTDEAIGEVMARGFTGWIDDQIDLPTLTLAQITAQNGLPISSSNTRQGWWRAANVSEGQLRYRMAYALSQILVVNLSSGAARDNFLVQGRYYDIFTKGAFGPYRDVLEQVTYSPVMGAYLSHLKNRKSDDPENPTRFPDENFAREIMQLFTIGLWELNPDGSRKLDGKGNFIPTYDNETITEMAKVFTGMSHSTTRNGQPATSFFNIPRGNDFLNPMKVWDEEHEPGPKEIVGGVVLDGNQTGEEEVQATLDALIAHESSGPFLSRLLIQRFTASNPSPSYLERVSRVWDGSGPESKGDLGKVIEAILLDPEVLSRTNNDGFSGKVREPIIRLASLTRAFDFSRASTRFSVDINLIGENLGQYPMLSPTVFNFYLPDFSPSGEFREAGLAAPELQIATLSQMIRSDSRFSSVIDNGHYGSTLDFADELPLATDVTALVDRVDLLLTGRSLADSTRAAIITAVEAQPSDLEKVRAAVYLVSQSMECIVLQ